MKIRVTCRDKYEAKKLASLIFVKDHSETFITQILNVFGNELVVSLKDKSVHSVILKNNQHVEAFADFIQSVLEKEHQVTSAAVFDNEVEITKGKS